MARWALPSKTRWEHEQKNHELYNSGHLMEAAVAHFLATGKRNFLDIAIKNADLLVENFGPGKLSVPPGHQIVETGLIRLYQVTGNSRYLRLAKYLLDIRGNAETHVLYGEYSQDHLPVVEQQEAVGHAVRAVYMYAGMTDVAALYHSEEYLKAVNLLWKNVVSKKMYLTGGIGSRHKGESFGAPYELPELTAYNETCATIGNVLWNQRLFLLSGNSDYFDVIERTLYNGLISGISLDGKHFFYPNPLESDGKFLFNKGQATRQEWFDCSCCPTNLVRFIPRVPGLVYALEGESVYVNLFVSNRFETDFNHRKLVVTQQTGYPLSGNVKLMVNPAEEMEFSLKLRIPGWARNQPLPGNLYHYGTEIPSGYTIRVNGKGVSAAVENGYAVISRKWKSNDLVELELPMKVQKVYANRNVPSALNKVAFEYGPFVYCAEEADNKEVDKLVIQKSTSFTSIRKVIEGENANCLTGVSGDVQVVLIPYYLWSNRGVGTMKVWFPEKL